MASIDTNQIAKLTRRQSLQLGAATSAIGLLPIKLATPAHASDPQPPKTTPFVVPLPVNTAKLPVSALNPAPTQTANVSGGECGRMPQQRFTDWPSQKFYTLKVREANHSFHPELPTQKIWGYDGMLPGPTFVEKYGVPITVRISNELPNNSIGFGSPEISTHLHNLHCASESDGFAGDYYSSSKFGPSMAAAGGYKDHHYPNCYAGYDDPKYYATKGDPREALGTLWYHDHRIDFTGPNCYKGLTGLYLLFDEIDSGNERDTNPKALRLPSGIGKYDIPLSFSDKVFDSSGYVVFDQFATKGILGNKFCVNGKIQPFFNVERRKYRFRMLDEGPSRFYEFYLTDANGNNQSFQLISDDGNLLPAPITSKNVKLPPASRKDIVVDFSKYPSGTKLFIVNRLIQTDGRGPEDVSTNTRGADGLLNKAGVRIMRFDITSDPAEQDMSQVPSSLRELPPINLSEVVATRRFEFDKENEIWTVNGKIFDVEMALTKPKLGTAEIWVLKGKGSWHHPVHIHLEEGRILLRNGQPPQPEEAGRKDVYSLAPDDELHVFMRFRDFKGKYMMHCHNLTHEDHAMMVRFDVV